MSAAQSYAVLDAFARGNIEVHSLTRQQAADALAEIDELREANLRLRATVLRLSTTDPRVSLL